MSAQQVTEAINKKYKDDPADQFVASFRQGDVIRYAEHSGNGYWGD